MWEFCLEKIHCYGPTAFFEILGRLAICELEEVGQVAKDHNPQSAQSSLLYNNTTGTTLLICNSSEASPRGEIQI